MPIYDQGYRRYEAREPLHQIRFWPITREALRALLVKKAFLGLLAVSFIPFLVFVVILYVMTRLEGQVAQIVPLDGRLLGEYFTWQMRFLLPIFVTIFGASGLIANDLRTGAILVYLSRPLTRRDYVLGKMGVPLSLNLAITLVPGLLLYGVALALFPDQFLKWSLAWIGPAVAVHSLLISVVLSLLMLAVSALSRSARVAGLAFFGLVFGLEMVRQVVQHGFGRREAILLSLQADFGVIGAALFGQSRSDLDIHWAAPAGLLLLVALACLAILRARVRAVEIVT
jgi:ABC-2 type transport system permease protein